MAAKIKKIKRKSLDNVRLGLTAQKETENASGNQPKKERKKERKKEKEREATRSGPKSFDSATGLPQNAPQWKTADGSIAAAASAASAAASPAASPAAASAAAGSAPMASRFFSHFFCSSKFPNETNKKTVDAIQQMSRTQKFRQKRRGEGKRQSRWSIALVETVVNGGNGSNWW